MADRPEKAEKQRVSVTMTQAYVEKLDGLVEEGLYLNRGQIVREGLRYVFRGYGLEPVQVLEGPPRKGGEEADLQGGR